MPATMDRLTKLPTLALTEIFIQLETEYSIRSLIRAYPSMIWLYHRYNQGILERILSNLLVDDVGGYILKDALAIMEFTIPKGHFVSQYRGQNFTMRNFQWPEWPDSDNRDNLRKLHRLFSRIIIFIEDYISKATSDYPPRSYLGIPDLLTGNPTFMGRLLDTKMVRFTSLTRPERHRLLRHFVRYELLCNIHKTYNITDGTVPRSLCNFNAFGTPNAPDPKLLLSVHEYYTNVYGAIFAHCTDAWLPSVPSALSLQGVLRSSAFNGRPLMFLDNIFFDQQTYLSDLDLGHSDRKAADELAGLGLNVLTPVLNGLRKDKGKGKTYVKSWLQKIQNISRRVEPWIRSHYLIRCVEEDFAYKELLMPLRNLFPSFFPQGPLTSHLPAVNRHLLLEGDIEGGYWVWPVHGLQVKLYRQRAWGFFDDRRLYSNMTSHFPSIYKLYSIIQSELEFSIMLENRFGKALATEHVQRQERERRRRRSQLWQDYWAKRRIDEPGLDGEVSSDDEEEDDFKFFNMDPASQRLHTTWAGYEEHHSY